MANISRLLESMSQDRFFCQTDEEFGRAYGRRGGGISQDHQTAYFITHYQRQPNICHIHNESMLVSSKDCDAVSATDSVGADGTATTGASDDDDDGGGDGDPDSDRKRSPLPASLCSTRKPRTPCASHPPAAQVTPLLPQTGLVRLPQVLAVIPVGRSTWWAGCKSGRFPAPVHLSPGVTCWRVEDIHALIQSA